MRRGLSIAARICEEKGLLVRRQERDARQYGLNKWAKNRQKVTKGHIFPPPLFSRFAAWYAVNGVKERLTANQNNRHRNFRL